MNTRVQQIFEQLCELVPEDRDKHLVALDESDSQHLNELRELFAAHDASAGNVENTQTV